MHQATQIGEAVTVAATAQTTATIAFHEAPADRLRRVFAARCDAIYGFIVVRVSGDRHAADDLLQQTCYEAAKKRRVPEPDDACEAWLFGIARNLVRKHWRTQKRRGVVLPLEDHDGGRNIVERMQAGALSADSISDPEMVTQLMLAITSMPATDQEIIFAFYFDGRSQQQIAEDQNTTVKSIEARLYRLRSRLRGKLQGLER